MKSLKDISWNVDETTYREDPALSYTIIARYEREGFNCLKHLYEKPESSNITFGSAVDTMLTCGEEEFNKKFFITCGITKPTDSMAKIVNELFAIGGNKYSSLEEFPSETICEATERLKYQLNWKPENRIKKVIEQGNEYYKQLCYSNGKTIIDLSTKDAIDDCISILKTSANTNVFFNDSIGKFDRFFQLKFKTILGDIEYKCMADLLVVDHINKIVYPVDLKTSSHSEWDFYGYESFVHWRYDIQARLYWRIIRDVMDKDKVFKDYDLDDFRFIVINKDNLIPLIWIFDDTRTYGTLNYGKNNQIELRDPLDIGQELHTYISNSYIVPSGIDRLGDNSITKWLNKL